MLVCLYAARYFDHEAPDSAARIAGLLVLFAAAMLLLVLADNLLLLYVGWELTTISSYLLIGNDHTDPRARAAALHALLVTSMGGLVMLAGLVLLGQAAGTYRLSAILADAAVGHHGHRGDRAHPASGRSPSRRSTRSTPGCPGRWPRRRR